MWTLWVGTDTFLVRGQASGGTRKGTWSTDHLKIQHMLTFLYCHSNLYDLLKSRKLAWWKCWQVFVKRILMRLFFCVCVSALYFKVMQLHVKILPWQQKLKWLSLQASRQERKRKCFILKLSTLHRTLEPERKCWGEGGLKKNK